MTKLPSPRVASAVILLLASTSVLAPRGAVAFSGGPPDSHTGAPGEPTCVACHLSFPLNSGTGSLALVGVPAEYEPGATYALTVALSDPAASRWGFELTALDAEGAKAGVCTPLDGNTQVSNALNGRQYLKHTFAGTGAGTTGGRQWSFEWTAPAAGVGTVTFWFAGNAANNNGLNSGDRIYATSAQVAPAQTTSVPDLRTAGPALAIAPNPFNPRTEIRFALAGESMVTLEILDARGRRVRSLVHGVRSAGAYSIVWNGRDDAGVELASGVFRARLTTNAGTDTRALTLAR